MSRAEQPLYNCLKIQSIRVLYGRHVHQRQNVWNGGKAVNLKGESANVEQEFAKNKVPNMTGFF